MWWFGADPQSPQLSRWVAKMTEKIYSLEWLDGDIWRSQISSRDIKLPQKEYKDLSETCDMSKTDWRIAVYSLESTQILQPNKSLNPMPQAGEVSGRKKGAG